MIEARSTQNLKAKKGHLSRGNSQRTGGYLNGTGSTIGVLSGSTAPPFLYTHTNIKHLHHHWATWHHRLAADEDGKCEITGEVLSLAILEGKSDLKNRIPMPYKLRLDSKFTPDDWVFLRTLQQTGTTVQKYKLQVHFSLLTAQLRWSMDLLLTYT